MLRREPAHILMNLGVGSALIVGLLVLAAQSWDDMGSNDYI
ncbi:MAG TPA: hypothetical protein VGW09_01515 [Nitrososphaeraceae archaeon]|nr:hypothetical protein [Nitrososphaeraceae archaeon]